MQSHGHHSIAQEPFQLPWRKAGPLKSSRSSSGFRPVGSESRTFSRGGQCGVEPKRARVNVLKVASRALSCTEDAKRP